MTITSTRRGTRALSIALAAATAVALAGCSSSANPSPSGEEEATVVRIANVQAFATFPLHIADEKGFFEDHGVDVELIAAAFSADFVAGLGRQYDMTILTPVDMLQATSQGAEVGLFMGLTQTVGGNESNPLLTTEETGPIESAEDLVGATIGVPSLTSSSALAIQKLLVDEGFSADDATLTVVPFPVMADQLRAGIITAAVSARPFTEAAMAEGGMVTGIDPMLLVAGDPAGVMTIASTPAWVDAHPNAAEGVYEAVSEAIQWISDNPDEAVADIAEWLQIPPAALEGVQFLQYSTDFTEEELQAWIDIMLDLGVIETEIDPAPLLLGP